MDFFKLDAQFQPIDLIENRETLIWTERYKDAGDFVLTTHDIQATMNALPIDSLVSIKESRELMFVETHDIDETEDGVETLTVSGRSFETWFENRTTLRARDPINDSAGEANDIPIENATASAAILSILAYSTGPFVDALDDLSSDIWRSRAAVKPGEAVSDRAIERTDAYAAIVKILGESGLGIRNYRPTLTTSYIMTEIYDGDDRSADVILSKSAGHFDTTKHLWSNKNYKTAAYSASSRYFTDYVRTGMENYTGFRRRVGLIDNSDITKAGTAYLNRTKTRGKEYLWDHPKTVIFEGKVSPDIPFIYGKHYALGDLIQCMGKYGINQKLMVTEYVRTEDAEGDQGYPSLSQPGDVIDE